MIENNNNRKNNKEFSACFVFRWRYRGASLPCQINYSAQIVYDDDDDMKCFGISMEERRVHCKYVSSDDDNYRWYDDDDDRWYDDNNQCLSTYPWILSIQAATQAISCHFSHTLPKSSCSYPHISPLPTPPLYFYRLTPNHPHLYAPNVQTTLNLPHLTTSATLWTPRRLYKSTLGLIVLQWQSTHPSHHHKMHHPLSRWKITPWT